MTISICQCCLNHSIDHCARNLHHLHPNSLLNARLRGCFFIPSPCCSAASASQLAVLTNEQPFDLAKVVKDIHPFLPIFFQWSPERKKLRMSIKPQGMSQFEGFFPWEAFQVVSPVISTIGSRINKSTVPTSRFWGSSPNPNIACHDFGSWIEEIMIVLRLYIYIHIHISEYISEIKIHIREREGRERELVRCYGKIDGVCICTYSFRNGYNDHGLT